MQGKKNLKGTKHLSLVVDAASSNLYSEFYTEYVKVIVFPTVFLLISNIRNGQECAVELLSLLIFMRFSIPVVFKHGLVGCRADSKGVPLLDELSSEAVTQKKVYGTSLISSSVVLQAQSKFLKKDLLYIAEFQGKWSH
ncbi:uncharacterized protein HKW66_Vig0256030 [Vigna angularis]|uniref:Uncharacterized protein n=1 Tax=Phaseolus angularis TaxID=3914 RepID=A0A8T0JVU5_PHAAN|nr:uncharacterized protein HKW66_Vig0256030 [Vigna angularis]